MKINNNNSVRNNGMLIILVIPLMIILLSTSGCKKDDDPSPAEVQTTALSSTWVIGSSGFVTLDGSDVTSYFSQFELDILADYSYSTIGGNKPNPWPASGKWSFLENSDGSLNLNKLVRDDGLEITIEELTSSTLRISFIHNESVHQSGRTDGVSGLYVFSLTNQ